MLLGEERLAASSETPRWPPSMELLGCKIGPELVNVPEFCSPTETP